MTAARALAEREQRAASDPGVSAFVAASAGSGKTKLLTDRLLRLMLEGAEPGRIQCLTFTKAGAAEMALRLQTRLGGWVTADDATLEAELTALDFWPDEPLRAAARCLFARVLDLPGGMRISTIHAFCQSLLRRFPLEAALSPQFELVDEAEARAGQRAAREALLGAAEAPELAAALAILAAQLTLDEFAALVERLQTQRERLEAALGLGAEGLEAAQRRVLEVEGASESVVLAEAVSGLDHGEMGAVMRRVARNGSDSVQQKALAALDWLALDAGTRAQRWADWVCYFFKKDGTAAADTRLVNLKLQRSDPALLPLLQAEQARVEGIEDRRRAVGVAELSGALMRLAAPAIVAYADQKAARDWLDYADLIGRTNALLREPGAAWVLYKLDGGLDHLLLDEVQDTAPDQWRIAEALTADFFTGAGARENAPARTVFAVGDRKQSIFSFQGADPSGFDHWRTLMAQRTRAAGAGWRDAVLDVSFRSTAPVLALVDAVFALPAAQAGVVAAGELLRHHADRADQAGRVELWPLAPRPPKLDAAAWQVASRYQPQRSAPQILADGLAAWIAAQMDGSVRLESRGRAMRAGDVLVLVRTRGAFDRALLRALKGHGVAVAGLDRMVLTDQPAVQDLLSLCDTLLLPEDSLSLACVLTSPLGGLSDDSLMALALGRRGSLWEALQARAEERAEWRRAHAMIGRLLARVDYVGPHALLSEVLGRMGGRARLFARLGPQAGEAIDELLATALRYACRHPPSMQGFLHWLRQSGAVVKREAEGAADAVRIMTVHGAKGLQAPLVILPDTTGMPKSGGGLVWAVDPGTGVQVPLWAPRKPLHAARFSAAKADAAAADRAEYNRLLYVALTRAEDRVVVCGWQGHGAASPECWYELVRQGFGGLGGVERTAFAAWEGERLSLDSAQEGAARAEAVVAEAAAAVALPDWAGAAPGWRARAAPAETAGVASLAPSRPEGAELGGVPAAASPLAERVAGGRRFRRGRVLHSLLQHLPNLAVAERRAAAVAFLARPGSGLTAGERAGAVDEVMGILEDPLLAPLFGPGSRAEVPLTGVVTTADGERVVGGLVDRLAVTAEAVLVADYKTNREPPAEVPALYVRQMAAYRAVLRGVFPGRRVRCVLIWTRSGRVDWLGEEG